MDKGEAATIGRMFKRAQAQRKRMARKRPRTAWGHMLRVGVEHEGVARSFAATQSGMYIARKFTEEFGTQAGALARDAGLLLTASVSLAGVAARLPEKDRKMVLRLGRREYARLRKEADRLEDPNARERMEAILAGAAQGIQIIENGGAGDGR